MASKLKIALVVLGFTLITCGGQETGVGAGGAGGGWEWDGEGRSVIGTLREARRQDRMYHGLTARERYLLTTYPTQEEINRIMP